MLPENTYNISVAPPSQIDQPQANINELNKNKMSIKFLIMMLLSLAVGAALAYATFFIEYSLVLTFSGFDVPRKIDPITSFVLIYQTYLITTLVFFIPLILVTRTKFKSLKIVFAFMIIIISISSGIYALQTAQSNKHDKEYHAKIKTQDDIDKYLSNNGVVHYYPGVSLSEKGIQKIFNAGLIENKNGVKGWFLTQNGLLGNKLILLSSFCYVSTGENITCIAYKTWPTVADHPKPLTTCEDIILVGKPAIYRTSEDKTVQFLMFDKGRTRLNIDIESDQRNTPTKEELINLVNREFKL